MTNKKLFALLFSAVLAVGVGATATLTSGAGYAIETKAIDGTKVATFTLGEDKNTTEHADGSSATTYSETVGSYTLSITDGVKMYKGGNDAKGNGALKFGTSSAVGSMKFTVPDSVTGVILHVGKYKANTTKINVNGAAYTLTNTSNNGAYDAIEVDTSTNKNVEFTTVNGGVRAMLNTIEFYEGEVDPNAAYVTGVTISVDNNTFVKKYTTADSWSTTGLVADVTMSDGSDYDGDINYTFSPETPAAMDLTDNGTLTITTKVNGIPSNTLTVEDIVVTAAKGYHETTPFTVSEAIDIINTLSSGANNGKITYVTGTVTGSISYNSNFGSATFDITDGTKTMTAYSISGATNDASDTSKKYVEEYYTVVVSGALINFKGTTPEVGYASGFNSKIHSSVAPSIASLESFATLFLSLPCEDNGSTYSMNWADIGDAYLGLTSYEKNLFANANAIAEGNIVEQAAARYDLLVAKYGLADFANRAPAAASNHLGLINNTFNFTLLFVVAGIALAASVVAVVVIKAKKAN